MAMPLFICSNMFEVENLERGRQKKLEKKKLEKYKQKTRNNKVIVAMYSEMSPKKSHFKIN